MSSFVQSIIIPKSIMSKKEAINWVKYYYEFKKIDETENTYRFRQYDPKYLKKHGYNNYYTHTLPNGVELVIAKLGNPKSF